MVLTSFIEGLHDAQLRWELRKSKPASPDAALALEVELHAFMEIDPSLRSGSQARVNMVSATPPQPLMETAFTSQEDMTRTLIQTIRQKIQKVYRKQIKTLRIHVQVVPTAVPFVLIVPDQIDKVQLPTKTKTTEIQTITLNTITVAISDRTDIATIAIHQTGNKTETTQVNKHIDIVTEQLINLGIVRPVLIAVDWDICLANVEHHDKIKTKGNEIRMLTKIREISLKTTTQTPHSNKIL